jgi:hypothetical protein
MIGSGNTAASAPAAGGLPGPARATEGSARAEESSGWTALANVTQSLLGFSGAAVAKSQDWRQSASNGFKG